jgi:alcohol dehydrogenase (cytochrome c)
MKRALLAFVAVIAVTVVVTGRQGSGLRPAQILKPSPDSWPTFHGDYTGRHYSTLNQINVNNVKNLSLAWIGRLNTAVQEGFVGGYGPDPAAGGGFANANIKATPLLVDGMLYVSTPNNAYALDARTGRQVWHYSWKSQGGSNIGNRGLGMWGHYLFLDTPDQYLVSLDAATGKERWNQKKTDHRGDLYATTAPTVIGNHVLTPAGGDYTDVPGWLESRDPETGNLQWKWYATPRAGEPGIETWPDVFSAERGGAAAWQPVTYDPELNLIFVGTGNPQPVLIGDSRKGDNLYTCSIVALNPDTGKLKWYFQVSPHDTHDWDATQTPVLFDAVVNGRSRKLMAQASRNGVFVLLDRASGETVKTTKYLPSANWILGFKENGQPIPNPQKEPQVGGALVSPHNGGATNWAPPSYSPQTGLFYVNTVEGYVIHYRTIGPGQTPNGYGGGAEHAVGGIGAALRALDPLTGKERWVHNYPASDGTQPRPEAFGGLLTTAGGLLFAGGSSGHVMAMEAATGKIVWHSGLLQQMSNTPITYMLDGTQYVLVAAGDTLYAFSIQR